MALRQLASSERATAAAWFFKTGEGEYGHGDAFIGVTVPNQRRVARQFAALSPAELDKLLISRVHEERSTALMILVDQFNRTADDRLRDRIFRYYMKRLRFVNNWDLVDGSAEHIVGGWLKDKPRRLLDRLAASRNLWSRRIAMIATFHYIKDGECADALRVARALLDDRHDLIHKAVGWMLREVGKRVSPTRLRLFLRTHAAHMPRTALRYAIEHFSPAERQRWMLARARSRR